MSWKRKYDIEFKGLKEGLHNFEYAIQNGFFEHFENGLVDIGDVTIQVELEKRSLFMKLSLSIKGWVELVCDRCLDSYRQEIENRVKLIVKFGENEIDDDEIFWIEPEEYKLNLAQLFYEYTVLSIPAKHLHPVVNGVSECNVEMLERLKQLERKERSDRKIDPRWEQLKEWNNN